MTARAMYSQHTGNHCQRQLTPDEREEWEERAAIMEFDAGMTRVEAELAALRIILDKRKVAIIDVSEF